MKKTIIVAALVGMLFRAIMGVVEMVRSGKWSACAVFQHVEAVLFIAIIVGAIVFLAYSFFRTKPDRDASELGDDDGGIDWREENAVDEVVQIRNGWAVLLGDVPVHEAKALAERLESAHMRCRLELLKEDSSFHIYGNWGMGTRMCVLVAPSDYAAAKKLLSPKE